MRFDADRLHATALGRQQDRAGSRERVEHPAPPRVALALDQVSRPLRREAGGVAEPAMERERKIVDKCGVGGPLTTTTGHGSSRWEALDLAFFLWFLGRLLNRRLPRGRD